MFLFSSEGWATPESNSGNSNSGYLFEQDVYSGSSTSGPLLTKTVNQYTGNNGYPNSCDGSQTIVYPPCLVMVVSSTTTFLEGTGSSSAPQVTTTNTYDDYNNELQSGYHNLLQQVITSSNAPTLTKKWSYTTNDQTVSGTVYYTVDKVTHSEIDDSGGHTWACQDTTYDEGVASGVPVPDAGLPTTVKAYSTCGNTSTAITTYSGYDAYGNPVESVDGVGTANSSLYTSSGCTLSTAPIYKSSGWSPTRYTNCNVYDSYHAQPSSSTNALSQANSLVYDYTQGSLPVSATDPNSQTITTSYSYDADGHLTSDVSGTRTIGINYDLLGRTGCIQDAAPTINATGACTSGTHPYVQNTYDTTVLGTRGTTDFPVGELTQSIATTYYPDSTSATVTEQFQHDQRERPVTATMQLTWPGSWGVTTPLPTYQRATSYNDANQPTTTTTSTNPTGQGYTTTNVYDSTSGALIGLSNTGTATANVALLTFTPRALINTITDYTTAGTGLSSEQYNYDANLRATGVTATWLSGSGSSGTILSQSRSYDPASNVTSLSTTLAAVPGVSSSGGSETQNFCYDEQDRLIWAGNSGTQPGAGNGTCGSGTLASSLTGASYSASYLNTHLGQLWQGPQGNSGTPSQYLYCDSSHPHQLTGLYSLGATCSTKTGQTYASLYDAWGNVTSRTVNGTTATLSYDGLDHLTKYDAGSNGQEQYVYDASGERVLRRSTSNGTTSMTVYAFGLEEHLYTGSGVHQSDNYYYSLGGVLVGESTGSGTNMFLTDALGSVIETISATANSATVQGNQVYSPYGSSRYQQGSKGTAKGFTGQYADSVSGLDYYNARYYDPVVGRFLSADIKLGSMQGVDPYAYVGGNPETYTDPTGMRYAPPPDSGGVSQTDLEAYVYQYATSNKLGASGLPALLDMWFYNRYTWMLAESYAENYLHTSTLPLLSMEAFKLLEKLGQFNWNASVQLQELYIALKSLSHSYVARLAAESGFGGSPFANLDTLSATISESASALRGNLRLSANDCGLGLSFTSTTAVTTDHGKQAIGTLHVGERVLAYNPKTHKMELEPIVHVWINHDHDLVDLTITTTTKGQHGKPATTTSEVVHTNQKHPFFTMEHGFLPVGQITLGMHLLRADGRVGVVTGWKVVPGTRAMYNLEVAKDHTFTVGAGQWVVHNCASGPQTPGEAYVQQNLSNLIPDAGGNLRSQVKFSVRGASAVADFVTDNAIIEVGGFNKNLNLSNFGKQLSVYAKIARGTGQKVYFLYDASTGPLTADLQRIASNWGVTIIEFTP